jgi:hypothetical protein
LAFYCWRFCPCPGRFRSGIVFRKGGDTKYYKVKKKNASFTWHSRRYTIKTINVIRSRSDQRCTIARL